MKALLNRVIGSTKDSNSQVQLDSLYKALATVLHHLSHLSPSINFESFCRHVTDALCHGLKPLQPIAAHFRIDVTTSHLWLPDASFKLDSFYRMQNDILINSQTRPVETSRTELFKTTCAIPYELHKHAIEITIYHNKDAQPQARMIAPIINGFTRAVGQAMTLRDEHLVGKQIWEAQVEKIIGSRLADFIYQTNSPFVFAKNLRAFKLLGTKGGNEQIFLHNDNSEDYFRAVFVRFEDAEKSSHSVSKNIAFFTALAAQLRNLENESSQPSFSDVLQYLEHSFKSLSHIIGLKNEIAFFVAELSLKTGTAKWHNAGLPPPMLFGKNAETVSLPSQNIQKPFANTREHDWQVQYSVKLPADSGLFFFTESVLKRLSELHTSASAFFERIKSASNAAQIILEAEKILSTPDSSRVVSASVTDWGKLTYDLSLVGLYNSGTSRSRETE